MSPKPSRLVVRIAFWTYWLVIYCWSVATFFLMLVVFMDGNHWLIRDMGFIWDAPLNAPFVILANYVHWFVYGMSLVSMAVIDVCGAAGMKWLMVTRVSTAEIKGFNALSLPTTIRWDEISDLKPLNLGGLKCLRICTKRHNWPLWFPLQISDRAGVVEKIAQINEKGTQLSAWLEKAST